MSVAGITETVQYLTFKLADEIFAFDVAKVREILELTTITKVPQTPEFMRGVINLRGSVVPVIDLAARFGGAPSTPGRRSCIVIVEVTGADGVRRDIGVLVDAVSEVLDIPPAEIEPPPSFGARIRADFIFGMGKVGGKFVVILDIDQLLSVDEIAQISATGSAAEIAGPSAGSV